MLIPCKQKDCAEHFYTIGSYIKHLHHNHFIKKDCPYLKLPCPFLCGTIVTSFSGFRSHLKKCLESIDNVVSSSPPLFEQFFDSPNGNLPSVSAALDLQSNGEESESFNVDVIPPALFEKKIFDFSSDLKSLGLPETTVNFIFKKMADLTLDFSNNISSKLKNNFPNLDSKVKDVLSEEVNAFQECFTSLDSSYKRSNVLKSVCPLLPEVREICLRSDIELGVKKGLHVNKIKARTFAYISVLDTLSFLLSNKSFQKIFFTTNETKKNDCLIEDIHDGSCFKNNRFFQKNKFAFRLQIYFDEFDPCDAIGAKKGIHKLGGIYFTLRNFPPYLNSSLDNIFLIGIFYSSDLKTHQFSKILDPLVRDLKKLEDFGILFPNDFTDKYIKGTVVALSFDNLGGNALLGLVESFRAHYFCRICKCDYTKISENLFENPILLRSKDDFAHCLAVSIENKETFFGVKDVCPLNQLSYFNTAENITGDIMHDIWEGVLPEEASAILDLFIENDVFTLEALNEKIRAFNYGFLEKCNKPNPVSRISGGKIVISGTCAQLICFAKFLPLIIGHIIPENFSEQWDVFLKLLDIINIVSSPRLTPSILTQLKFLIADHHQEYLNLFPDRHLLPKHHFMTHYPSIGGKMGPFIHLWCMRFEGKNKFFKRLGKRLNNFNNICTTYAKRHQTDVTYRLAEKKFDVQFSHSPSKSVKVCDLPESDIICLYLNVNVDACVEKICWVKRFSILYKPGFFLFKKLDEFSYPIFYKIVVMFIYEDEYYVLAEIYESLSFEKKLHSYKVSGIGKYTVFLLKNLSNVFSFEKHLNEGSLGDVFITPGMILF